MDHGQPFSAQTLYDSLVPHIRAALEADNGGSAAVKVLATLLGQVYRVAPDDVKPKLLETVLDELVAARPYQTQEQAEAEQAEIEMSLTRTRPKRVH